MSTKIYDAYRIKTMSELSRKEMLDTIKQMLLKRQEERLINLFQEEIIEMLDTVRVQDFYKQYDKVKNYCRYTAGMMNTPSKNIENAILGKSSCDPHYALTSSIHWALRDRIENTIKHANINRTILLYDYDFSSKIVFYPFSTKHTLIQVFGKDIVALFYELCYKNNEFKETYKLEDYHYQNQTDKPDDISGRAWKKREKDWDKVMKTGVPICDGICVEMSFNEYDFFEMFQQAELTAIDTLPSLEERIDKQATEVVLNACYADFLNELGSKPSVSEIVEERQNVKTRLKNKDEVLVEKVESVKEEIRHLFFNITKASARSLFNETKLSSLYPNYNRVSAETIND